MSIFLSQSEANTLLYLEKIRKDEERRRFPDLGGHIEIPLTCVKKREIFSLDIKRKILR
jgi:hypothetical protein